jgi:hypothetical protein
MASPPFTQEDYHKLQRRCAALQEENKKMYASMLDLKRDHRALEEENWTLLSRLEWLTEHFNSLSSSVEWSLDLWIERCNNFVDSQ